METRREEGRKYSSTRVDSHARCGEIIKDFFFHTRIKMGEKIRLKFNSFFLFEKKYSGHLLRIAGLKIIVKCVCLIGNSRETCVHMLFVLIG